MSSSKKKPTLTTCQVCESIILAKDTARHGDFCGKELEESEISCIKSGVLRGFNTAMEKGDGYLPPDAIGWEKEHSILMSPQTMENFGILPRQPVRLTQSSTSTTFIGVVWPCKEVALLKVHTISSKVQRERMCLVEKIEKPEKVSNLACRIESEIAINNVFREFAEMYLSHSFLQYGCAVVLRFLGQEVEIIAEEGCIEKRLEELAIGENKKPKVVGTAKGFRLQILNDSGDASSNGVKGEKPKTDLNDVGGMFGAKQVIEDYFLEPVKRNEKPCSILLWGLPGSGKTYILKHLQDILGSRTTMITNNEELAEIETLVPEGSENRILIIIDINEIDKENSKALNALRQILSNEKFSVILSVRSSESLDIGFRVRFPVEAEITVPTQNERIDILRRIGVEFGIEGVEVDIARQTHGFTAGDLCSLLNASKFAKGEGILGKIEVARKRIRPTGIRQFILEVPNVSWADIGGNEELKLEIQQAVIWPQKHPEAFERFGIDPPAGILLYGPPGCSKTLIARALANEAKMNFLAVKGPELFSKWVGDSEKAIRDLFSRARQVAPTIVFFDEIDAVGSSRGSEKSSGVSDRVLAQLLTELDGLEKSSRVILLAATNRPDQLDSALLRPGRLDRAICVGLPCDETRRAILRMRTRKMVVEGGEKTIETLVNRTKGYSGAELVAVCRTAAMFAMREDINANQVGWKHFEQSLSAVVARTEAYLLEIYEDFKAGRTSNA